MPRSKTPRRIPNAVSVALDVAIVAGSMMLAYWVRFNVFEGEGPIGTVLEHGLWAAAFSPVYILLYSLAGLYDPHSPNSTTRLLGRTVLCNTVAMMLYVDVVFLFRMVDYSRWLIVCAWAVTNVLSCTKTAALDHRARVLCEHGVDRERVVVVGSGETARTYARAVAQADPPDYDLLGSVGATPLDAATPHLGTYPELRARLEGLVPDIVVVALDADEYGGVDEVLRTCEGTGIRVMLLPTYHRLVSTRPHMAQQAGLPLVALNRIALDNMGYAFLKRAFDVVGSALLIVLTSPILLAAAVGTKLSSPGPVIFSQERIGRGREPFHILKFRSMRVNAESDTAWTTSGDPRRTRFGSFMRRYSIDELPQLFNVLKGDMSLVGPRPEIPQYVEHFKDNIPLYMVRHRVRPGMTGWAQVNGLRGDTSIERRIEYDLFYIDNWSMLFDLRILFMTPFRGIVNKQEPLANDQGR